MALSAPAVGHPEARHDVARLRLLARAGDEWDDLGHVFGADVSPGSREWSGIGGPPRRRLGLDLLHGRRPSRGSPPDLRPTSDRGTTQARDRRRADPARTTGRAPRGPEFGRANLPAGRRARRGTRPHPSLPRPRLVPGAGRWPRVPARRRLGLVAGPLHGAVALATERRGGWSLLPPLVVADGINHELERPHVVVHESRYYLFLVTQRHTFHPPGSAPTGLYGFVAPSLTGPHQPLNGSGLVIRNPSGELPIGRGHRHAACRCHRGA
jgi:levansucrase